MYAKQQFAIVFPSPLTLKSWTPMQANMKSSSMVTSTIFPMVLTATNTHWTTCYEDRDIKDDESGQNEAIQNCKYIGRYGTLSPLALLMALRGLSTLNTLRIFTTEMALDLNDTNTGKPYLLMHHLAI